jgi:hypothetical protein
MMNSYTLAWESRMHYFMLDNKKQSVEFHHKISAPKKFKTGGMHWQDHAPSSMGCWRHGAFWIHAYWPTLSCAVKQLESLKLVLTCSRLPFNMTVLTCTKVWEELFDVLVSLSWIIYYTPYLVLLNLNLFPKLREDLRQHIYMSEDEVKTVVKLWFHHQYAQFYHNRLWNYLNIGRSM